MWGKDEEAIWSSENDSAEGENDGDEEEADEACTSIEKRRARTLNRGCGWFSDDEDEEDEEDDSFSSPRYSIMVLHASRKTSIAESPLPVSGTR
jgi:hypothetical protein